MCRGYPSSLQRSGRLHEPLRALHFCLCYNGHHSSAWNYLREICTTPDPMSPFGNGVMCITTFDKYAED